MTLGGLWHGASWNFVLWGVLHGLLLIGHRLWQEFCRPRRWLTASLESLPGTVVRIATTGLCVCLCWVFFRAQSFTQAAAFFERLIVPGGTLVTPLPAVVFALLAVLLVLGHLLAQRRLWQRIADRLPAPLLGACYAVFLSMTLLLAPPTGKTFIYFQF
jgi:alginate O-acetyltransferase complex protein AlgI